ncbi:MAG TPA: hypothetical protein VH025_05820, partial [Solirubrobacteraceae bacterium]|nr:hypothetical protein [Solirubrobacteraceae bacterium]
MAATLALVFSMSGGALAAKHYLVSSTKQISPNALESLRAIDRNVFKNQSKSVVVAKATTATTATTANSATTAATATNADALGGIAAAGFTHTDCNSRTGQVKGFAMIRASEAVSAAFTQLGASDGYNCSGQPVEVKRESVGHYVVKFVGSPVGIVVGSSNAERGGGTPVDVVSVRAVAAGEFAVTVFNIKEA